MSDIDEKDPESKYWWFVSYCGEGGATDCCQVSSSHNIISKDEITGLLDSLGNGKCVPINVIPVEYDGDAEDVYFTHSRKKLNA